MFFEEKGNLIVLRVRLTPSSSSCLIKGIYIDSAGVEYLKINVISVPEKGKANQELIRLLAKALKIAKGEIQIISGETDRHKKLTLPNQAAIFSKLQDWGKVMIEGESE